MKIQVLFVISLVFLGCENHPDNGFTIRGKIGENYEGTIYLYYDGKIQDSSLVNNSFFHFRGKLQMPMEASISSGRFSASNRNFFIENTDIHIQVSYTQKKIGEYELDWFDIDSVSGPKTAKVESEIQKMLIIKDSSQKEVLFKRFREIIELYKNHPLAGSILHELSNDTIFSKEDLSELYKKIEETSQSPYDLKIIEYNIGDHPGYEKGDTIYDFMLPTKDNIMLDTKEYRTDSYVLIDFWASWCGPCIKGFPELKKTYNLHKKNNFKILGVSLDKNIDKWELAVANHKLPWDNIIDTAALDGSLAIKYKIKALPYNVLVDSQGIIIGVKLDNKALTHKLDSIFK